MKIGVVTPLLELSAGGPSYVVRSHLRALSNSHEVTLFGPESQDGRAPCDVALPADRIWLFPHAWPRRWGRLKGLSSRLQSAMWGQDVLHAHMLWDQPVLAALRAAAPLGRGVVLTPHGSLADPWRVRALHKRLYLALILNPLLRSRCVIQAMTEHEAEQTRKWFDEPRIVVIPNGLPETSYRRALAPTDAYARWRALADHRSMLYLGRMAPGKGLETLLALWKRVFGRNEDWILVLAGPDYRGHEVKIRALADSLGIGDRVLFTGMVTGALKDSLFAAADVMVLLSAGEGFSVSILEGMASRLPVVYSRECHFPELAAAGGGWEVPFESAEIESVLAHVRDERRVVLREMGNRAWQLGAERYTESIVERKLTDVYRSLL